MHSYTSHIDTLAHFTHTHNLCSSCAPQHTHTHTCTLHTHTHNLCSSCAPQHTHTLAHFTHTDALAYFRCTSLSSLGWGSSGRRGSCRQRRATALPCCHSRPSYRAAEPPACSPDGRNLPGPRQEDNCCRMAGVGARVTPAEQREHTPTAGGQAPSGAQGLRRAQSTGRPCGSQGGQGTHRRVPPRHPGVAIMRRREKKVPEQKTQ